MLAIHILPVTVRGLIISGITCWLGFGCFIIMHAGTAMADAPKYFTDVKSAVVETARMMRARSWPELAHYYDLSETDIAPGHLESGAFFMRPKPPEIGHPAGFGFYIQPFAPEFSYLSHKTVGSDVIEVTVQIEIDQGGGMIQRGLDSFRLRRSQKGYRLLPKLK